LPDTRIIDNCLEGNYGMRASATRENVAYGMSWDHPKKGRLFRAALAAFVAASFFPVVQPASAAAGRLVSVIVRELPGTGDLPEQVVEDLGGTVARHIGILRGFVARVPSGGVATLRGSPGVHSVTPDGRLHLHSDLDGDGPITYAPGNPTKAGSYWSQGYTGKGVDVALIDSGVVPVDGLTAQGKVINGPDLSFESQSPDLRYLDTFGHGTHMAGIIAGGRVRSAGDVLFNMGVAPEARLLSLKVADVNGVTDVSQVIAAIDWVVQHRNDNGMNIRVLNLSFGTDGTQDYKLDPLSYAVEVAWHKGIVVVVSGGNTGFGTNKLNNPAYNPYVIAVGALDTKGTNMGTDDAVASFSSCGNAARRPDLVAPGTSVLSLRDPGSKLDVSHPGARVEDKFFKGSGTSQAAAVVSGAAALVINQRPSATPDQVKALLTSTAAPLPLADPNCQGAGTLNLRAARDAPTPLAAVQAFPPSTGLGTLEGARGSVHITDGTTELRGEQDIFGTAWDAPTWAAQSLAGTSWVGGTWNGNQWAANAWSGMSWSGMSWGGMSWGGMSWGGMSWGGMSWGGMSWGGMSWGGMAWGGMAWGGMAWGGLAWGGMAWSSGDWT
jgi:serine protease AprX